MLILMYVVVDAFILLISVLCQKGMMFESSHSFLAFLLTPTQTPQPRLTQKASVVLRLTSWTPTMYTDDVVAFAHKKDSMTSSLL